MEDTQTQLVIETWIRHAPDDAGKCPVCGIYGCQPRRDAARALDVRHAGINVTVIERTCNG